MLTSHRPEQASEGQGDREVKFYHMPEGVIWDEQPALPPPSPKRTNKAQKIHH